MLNLSKTKPTALQKKFSYLTLFFLKSTNNQWECQFIIRERQAALAAFVVETTFFSNHDSLARHTQGTLASLDFSPLYFEFYMNETCYSMKLWLCVITILFFCFIFMCMDAFLHVCPTATCVQCPQKPEGGIRFLGAAIQTPILWKNINIYNQAISPAPN